MVRSDIELLDRDYFRIPLVKPSRKIKFKGISFKNILSRWNSFRLDQLKKKIASKKEKLVEMEFHGEDIVPGKQRERIEKKVLRKTQAIARLESKLNFLETGKYYSEEFEGSRAIKLKDLMMKNLEYNRNSLYGVTEQAAEEIITGKKVTSVIDEEAEKIGARVREILSEKAKSRKSPTENSTGNTAGELEKNVTDQVIDSVVEGIDVTPVVSNDEVAAAIDTEMQKINVSRNESSPAKVNKFINEDGTYRLRREDIDEDFRITRFDRSKLPVSETTPIEVADEPEIPPFSTTAAKRKAPDVEPPRKALTEIVERTAITFPPLPIPTIKEEFGNKSEKVETPEPKRVAPVVVPERSPIRVRVVKKPVSVEISVSEETSDYGDFGTLLARVNLLAAEKRTIDNMRQEATQKAHSVDSAHRETMRRLSEFADSLEADCNASYQSMNEIEKTAARKEAQITAMVELMAAMPSQTENTKGRAK
jgi:hypothetical protein